MCQRPAAHCAPRGMSPAAPAHSRSCNPTAARPISSIVWLQHRFCTNCLSGSRCRSPCLLRRALDLLLELENLGQDLLRYINLVLGGDVTTWRSSSSCPVHTVHILHARCAQRAVPTCVDLSFFFNASGSAPPSLFFFATFDIVESWRWRPAWHLLVIAEPRTVLNSNWMGRSTHAWNVLRAAKSAWNKCSARLIVF